MPTLGLILLTLVAGQSDADLVARAQAKIAEAAILREDASRARPLILEAIGDLETLQERGHRNPALSLQLGHARLLADDLAGAILAYRQGLDVAPGERPLLASLDYARSLVSLPAGKFGRAESDDLPPWLPRPGPTTLVLLALAALTLGCVSLTRWRMTQSPRWLTLALVAFVVFTGIVAVLIVREQALSKQGPLVVIAEDGVLLRRGDGLAYPARYETPLARGTEAQVRFARGSWLRIELPGGETGWVPRDLTREGAR